MKEFDYEKLYTATDGFSPSRLIGKGSHGYIYEALLHHNVVAIKTPSLSPSPSSSKSEQTKKLENEINVLSSLPCNPHVLTFLGHSEKRLMVVEFMPNGSLHELLHVSKSLPLTWIKRIEIALKIARGIHFLHEQDWAIPLIHNGKIGEICDGGVLQGMNIRLLRMAARCVSSDVESRPSFGEITAEIASCLTEPMRSIPLWISVFRGVVKLKRRRKRLREKLTWPGQTCRVR